MIEWVCVRVSEGGCVCKGGGGRGRKGACVREKKIEEERVGVIGE